MKSREFPDFETLLSTLFKSHPWHGVSPGDKSPDIVSAYIEIVPTGAVKLELDKRTGHLHVDRPQRFSSMCPMLYGFIPQTYCGDTIGELCSKRTGIKNVKGDGDALDICILTERDFAHGDLFVTVRPIGGLRMVDKGQADDKIVAVLDQDIAYGGITDIAELPDGIITRLKHYFLSYKRSPDEKADDEAIVQITDVYGRKESLEVIRRSIADYEDKYGTQKERLAQLRAILVAAHAAQSSGGPKTRKPKVSQSSGAPKSKPTKTKTKTGSKKR